MRTLRFIGMAIIAVIMSVNFTACSDDDGDEVIFVLSEEDKTMQFTDEGGEKNISFKLNSEEWHSYPTDKAVNWVSYTPQEGNRGDNTVTFKVLRNIGPSRNYSVTFSSQYNPAMSPVQFLHLLQEERDTFSPSCFQLLLQFSSPAAFHFCLPYYKVKLLL